MAKFVDLILYEVGDKVKVINPLNADAYMERYGVDVYLPLEVTEARVLTPTLGDEYQIVTLNKTLTLPSIQVEPTDPESLAKLNELKKKLKGSYHLPKSMSKGKTKTKNKSNPKTKKVKLKPVLVPKSLFDGNK